MIKLCINSISLESLKEIAEFLTGIGTIVLAIVTFRLARLANRQLQDFRTFIDTFSGISEAQSVENTIIKQIEFHHKIIDRITAYSINGQYMDFRNLAQTLDGIYKKKVESTQKTVRQQMKDAFNQLYLSTHGVLGSYYKNLYCLIKYINDLKTDTKKKSYYIELVKAQLSKYEIILLFYNCIWITDQAEGKNFIDYAIGLNLLSALEEEELIRPTHKTELDNLKREYERDKKVTSLLQKES